MGVVYDGFRSQQGMVQLTATIVIQSAEKKYQQWLYFCHGYNMEGLHRPGVETFERVLCQ